MLENCPHILDVETMVEILRAQGCQVMIDGSQIRVRANAMDTVRIPADLVHKMRSSIILMGAVLARMGEVFRMVRIYDMKQKEVVNIRDGCRLGFICDIEVDLTDGMIKNIIVPGQGKLFGILGREMEYVIAWCQICKIGADIILVDIDTEKCLKECCY